MSNITIAIMVLLYLCHLTVASVHKQQNKWPIVYFGPLFQLI